MAADVARGLTVCTNVTLKPDGFAKLVEQRYGVLMQPSQVVDLRAVSLTDFHRVTPQGEAGAPVRVYLDECHLEFNSRDWNKTSRELLAFLTQSRKQHTDIIFISQSALNIDKQFRVLCGRYVRHKDLSRWCVPGLGIPWGIVLQVITFGIHSGDQILQCIYDRDAKTLQKRHFKRKEQLVFDAYDTFELLSEFSRSGSAKKMNLEKTKKRGGTLLRVLMFLVFLGLVGVYCWNRWGKPKMEPPKAQNVQTVEKPPAPAVRETVQAVKRDMPGYEIVVEDFRATDERTYLRTSGGQYNRGAMSARGMVVAVQGYVAKVTTPSGGTVYVVAESKGQGFVLGGEVAAVTAPQGKVTFDDMPAQLRVQGGYPGEDGRKARDAMGGYPASNQAPALP